MTAEGRKAISVATKRRWRKFRKARLVVKPRKSILDKLWMSFTEAEKFKVIRNAL
jgi:hypothetical protein